MNLRLIFCIGMGLFTTFLGIVMLLNNLHREPPHPPRSKRNFSAREAAMFDPESGEKTTYREITVATKFAPGPGQPKDRKLD